MIPYGRQYLDRSDRRAVLRTLKSDRLTQGPKVSEFETALAAYCHTKYAVAVSSGTAALHLAYLAAGLGPGDEVITTPNTFVATANMLLAVGTKPVFGDIRPDTYNLDESKIESLITARTKAIVPVHFAGHPCAMDKIWDIAAKHNLTVIEDAAHALGASYQNTFIGGGQSAMAIFSFHPVKLITTGEGGAIITNNQNLYEKLKLLRSHGVTKDKNGFNVMTELGYNYRLPDINAALGLSQLKKLKRFIQKRQELAGLYLRELKDFPEIILPVEHQDVRSSWHLFVIRTKNPTDRLPLYEHLKQSGIGVNFHYPPVYTHPYYRKHSYRSINLPVAESYASTAMTIPLYPHLKKNQVRHISEAIKKFFYSRSYVHLFNQLADQKNATVREGHLISFHPRQLIQETSSEISKLLNIRPDHSVLDLGGGTGEIANYLAPACRHWTLADGSSTALTTAKKNLASYNNIDFVEYDIIRDPFPWSAERFDRILCYSVLQYLENDLQLHGLIAHLLSVLSANGRLLLGDVPLKEKKEAFLARRRQLFFTNAYQTTRYLFRKWLTRLLYQKQKVVLPDNVQVITLTEEKIRKCLSELPQIKYQFLEQRKNMEHAGSRINIIITK